MQRTAFCRSRHWRRFRVFRPCLIAYLCVTTLLSGCRFPGTKSGLGHHHCDEYSGRIVADVVRQTEYPDTSIPCSDTAAETPEPRTLKTALPEDDESQYWNLSLQEAIHYGLTNSKVLNDLGGTILRYPDSIPSNLMAAIIQSDPRFGIEGALSAYDTRFNLSNKYENNNEVFNNLFLSGGNAGRTFSQHLNTSTAELVKNTISGGQVAVRNITVYDENSMPSNLFPASWTTMYEAEARQSLLQGAGTEFNSIAGALGQPGWYNGVKIARIRTDITQAEFEIALRDYLSNLENAYWDLHFAYRELASKVDLRDVALEVYGLYKNRVENQKNEESYRLAQVREQYYRLQQDADNALTGRRVDGTRTNNGTIPGTFRGGSGVYVAERRLRLLMGVTTSDARLIRPTDEASAAEIVMDWEQVKAEALMRRPELHRQKFQIKKAELELMASRNYLKPRLDIVAKYQARGFGQSLFGSSTNANAPTPAQQFQNAYGNLATGEFGNSTFGAEFSMPIGYRQGHAAVAQAEFRVARERAVLHEQERQVVHDVGNAVADLTRSHAMVVLAAERRSAALEYLDGMTEKIRHRDFGASHLEQWLDAQRRFADADAQYHQMLCEHQIAMKNVNYEKGSLLDYCNIAPIDGLPSNKPDPQAETLAILADAASAAANEAAPEVPPVSAPARKKSDIQQVSATEGDDAVE